MNRFALSLSCVAVMVCLTVTPCLAQTSSASSSSRHDYRAYVAIAILVARAIGYLVDSVSKSFKAKGRVERNETYK